MKRFLFCALASIVFANASPEIITQAGMTLAFGVDGKGSESEIDFGIKCEPGVNFDKVRLGLDAELAAGFSYTQNMSEQRPIYEDETNAVPDLHLKLGVSGYYELTHTAKLLAEPYVTLPLLYSDELCRLSDEAYVGNTQLGYGITAGAQFSTYYQFTVSFERSWFKPYNRDISKIRFAFNILWQSTSETHETPSYTPPVYYASSYTPRQTSTNDTLTYAYAYTDTTTQPQYNASAYSGGYTYVRGHFRHYKSGKVSYVRGHYRRK